MKKLLFSALTAITFATSSTTARDIAITADKLPQEAKKFLNDYFPQNSVVSATHDNDITDNDYTVILDNGTKIEFDSAGRWESVKSRNGKMAAGVVPAAIQGYITEHYPTFGIEKIERKRFGYEVELTNNIELKFDSKGKFMGADN